MSRPKPSPYAELTLDTRHDAAPGSKYPSVVGGSVIADYINYAGHRIIVVKRLQVAAQPVRTRQPRKAKATDASTNASQDMV